MPVVEEDFCSKFAEEAEWFQKPANTGLNFIVMATLFYFRASELGATRKQMDRIVLGSHRTPQQEHQSGCARVWAIDWQKNGIPDEKVKCANSTENAFRAALEWLGREGVWSQEAFLEWRRGGNTNTKYPTALTRVVGSIRGSIANFESVSPISDGGYSAAELAEELIDRLPERWAREFYLSVAEAFVIRFGRTEVPEEKS